MNPFIPHRDRRVFPAGPRSTAISRRALLGGAAAGGALVTLPLPRLGAMFDGNGTAYAADGQRLQRFGVYFVGNGFVPGPFAPRPRATGPIGELGTQLLPLAALVKKITVASGFELKTGRTLGVPHGHFAGGLTGVAATPNRVFQAPTIDQVIAQGALGAGVPYRSLEVAVANATPGVGQKIYHAVSHRGPNQPNDPEYSPAAVFARIFKGFTPRPADPAMAAAPPPAVDPSLELDKSLLDAVSEDARALAQRLGREDRARLQSHLEGIRSLETRIAGLGAPGGGGPVAGACKTPGEMAQAAETGSGLNEQVAALQADLVVAALSCDLTRVFFYQLTKPAAHVNYGIPDVTGDFHGICHGDAGNDQLRVQKGVAHTMKQFAGLLAKMDAVNEGSGTLLDNASVMVSTCVSWGKTHTQWEWPCVIGGRGGLRPDGNGYYLKGGWHLRAPNFDNFNNVLLTLMNLNGANAKTLGKDASATDHEDHGIFGG
jgi:hypothetical protein